VNSTPEHPLISLAVPKTSARPHLAIKKSKDSGFRHSNLPFEWPIPSFDGRNGIELLPRNIHP